MLCCLEIIPFQTGDASLLNLRIHLLKLDDRKLLDVILDDLYAFTVVGQIGTVSFQTDHVQRFRCLQGAVKMEVLARVLGLVQVR